MKRDDKSRVCVASEVPLGTPMRGNACASSPITVTLRRDSGQLDCKGPRDTAFAAGSRFETWHQSWQVLFALEGLATRRGAFSPQI
jgi:hypothetical protein